MNTIAGKPLALALALAAGLLAVLFAMGVFAPRSAQAAIGGQDISLSNSNAGAAVQVTVTFTQADGDVSISDQVVVKLEDFGVPSSIDPDRVLVRTATQAAPPADVAVSGTTITVEIGDMSTADGPDQPAGTSIDIVFRQRAGITNPTLAGEYTPKITVATEDEANATTPANIVRTLKVSPASAQRGVEITVSGAGYVDGTVGVYQGPNGDSELKESGDKGSVDVGLYSKLASAEVSNGSFTVSFNVDHEKFTDSDNYTGDPDIIQAHDAGGYYGPPKVFNLLPTMTLPASVTRGKDLTIKLKDWDYGEVTLVEISGAEMTPVGEFPSSSAEARASAGFKVTVGQLAQLGRQTVTVTGAGGRDDVADEGKGTLTGTIDIVSLDLNVQPSTAVVGQSVTVTGDGFVETTGATITGITIGGETVSLPANNIDDEIAAGGTVVATFKVPDASALSGADDYTIQITDSGGRTGTVDLTIPSRTISIDPTESRIGSSVTVNCTGFPTGASKLVTIKYDGDTVTTTSTDSSGVCSEKIIEVPNNAGVGSTHKVRVEAEVGDNTISAETNHKTPKAEVNLSSQEASRGSRITISGANFNTFRPVRIEIGDSNVTPSPAPNTDRDGKFSVKVLVPGVSLGNRNVKVTVNEVPVVVSMKITDAPVIETAAQVFAPLGDALEVVWYYDNATQSWSFYDPDPAFAAASDLTTLPSGNSAYSVQLSEEATFEGRTYPAGWVTIILTR